MLLRKKKTLRILLFFSVLLIGCGQPEQSQRAAQSQTGSTDQPESVTPEAQSEAEQIFGTRCAPCHGPQGHGDGPASAGLTPHPANFSDATWQQGVTDEHIEKIIQYGGAAVGRSPAMPGNPDLMSKPSIVAALRAHIRALGNQ